MSTFRELLFAAYRVERKRTANRTRLTRPEMAARRAEGATLQEIAAEAGVSRERVRQMLLTREAK